MEQGREGTWSKEGRGHGARKGVRMEQGRECTVSEEESAHGARMGICIFTSEGRSFFPWHIVPLMERA